MQKHILNILATWRLTELLHDEDMPFEIGTKLRAYIAENSHVSKLDYNGNLPYMRTTVTNKWLYEIHEALGCKWCLSIWTGLFVACVTRVNPLWAFAYSAASLLFDKLFHAIPITAEVDRMFDSGTN